MDIENILQSHGVKPTPQRVVITEFLVGTHSHPTAEEVFQSVSGKLPVALSRATVYNTLNALVEAGVIKEVFTEPHRARYDANVTEHHHFVDVVTGEVFDVEPQQIKDLPVTLADEFEVKGYHVTFYGTKKRT